MLRRSQSVVGIVSWPRRLTGRLIRRETWRFAFRLFLALVVVLPMNVGCPLPTPTAHANSGDDSGNGDEGPGDDCPRPEGSGLPPTEGEPLREETANPVHVRRGASIEQAIDLSLPGPRFGWSHVRSYDSGLLSASGAAFNTAGGERWHCSSKGPYLTKSGSANVALNMPGSVKRVFTYASTAGGVLTYNPPAGWRATLTRHTADDEEDWDNDLDEDEDIHYFTLTHEDTGAVYIFTGLDSPLSAEVHGRLGERTSRDYVVQGLRGVVYTYNSEGFVESLSTAEPQTNSITYAYDFGRVSRIAVHDGAPSTPNEIQYAEYTYFDSGLGHDTSLGDDGDLVQIKIGQKMSDGNWQTRFTQYRYYRASATDGSEHQLKIVLEPDAIQRAIDYSSGDSIDDAGDLLAVADGGTITDGTTPKELKNFASRSFTYYTTDLKTDNSAVGAKCVTPWSSTSGENLNNDYGGANLVEYDSTTHVGLVKTENVGSECTSCGGPSMTVTKTYFYLNRNSTATNRNVVQRIVVEDTDVDGINNNGNQVSRTLYGLNKDGIALRKAVVENPTLGTLSAWCESTKLGDDGLVAEIRKPSSHTLIDSKSELATFLNPYNAGTNSWTNDTSTLNPSDGMIYVFGYYAPTIDGAPSSDARVYDVKVKKGKDGAVHYLSATDYGNGSAGKPKWLPTATHVYPERTTNRFASSRLSTTYTSYFWDSNDKQLKVRVTTLPSVDATKNGSGTATKTYECFDESGRLRWTKDGEGYVNYYSYNAETGRLALEVKDQDTTLLHGVSGTGGNRWLAWSGSLPADGSNYSFARGGTLPSPIVQFKSRAFDNLGRKTLDEHTDIVNGIGPNKLHYTRYEVNKTLKFYFWTGGTSGNPALPIQVQAVSGGGVPQKAYSIAATSGSIAWDAVAGMPKITSDTQSEYVALTTYLCNRVNGQLSQVNRYHNIPSSGIGQEGVDSASKNYYGTRYYYDLQGRRSASAEYVDDAHYQVTVKVLDFLGRLKEIRRGVDPAVPANFASIGGASLASGHARTVSFEYDSGVGDGHLTSRKQFFGIGANDFLKTVVHRTFRGHVRGVEGHNGLQNPTEVSPFLVIDVDWLGRETATSIFTTEPSWFNNFASVSDDGYASAAMASGRIDLTTKSHDQLGRAYRIERYPGTSLSKIQANFYYNRNNQPVCMGEKYSSHFEFAYDGLGRKYQERIVANVQNTLFDSTTHAFNYSNPEPTPSISSMSTSGDEGLVFIRHIDYDWAGNTVAKHHFEMNHTDTNGIDGTGSYVRQTAHMWYDRATRLTAQADWGSGNSSSLNLWAYSTPPTRNPTEPSWTDPSVYDGKALLTKFEYHPANGRQESVVFGLSKNASDTRRQKVKAFYDDLGRRQFVVENFVGTYDPTSSPSSSAETNRTTGWKYNGLGQVTTLTAYNSNSTLQSTKYFYEDDYDASFITNVIFPDSSETTPVAQTAATSPAFNQVRRTYNLDGTLATLADQRGVVHQFTFNARRQWELDKATNIPSGVYGGSGEPDAVRSIKRSYDERGRLKNVYSYDDANASGNVLNRLEYYHYDSSGANTGQLWFVNQYHSATSPKSFVMIHDVTADPDGIFNDQLRTTVWGYPKGSYLAIHRGHADANQHTDNLDDRLGRITATSFQPPGTSYVDVAKYKYNGSDRLVETDYPVSKVLRRSHSLDGAAATEYAGWDRHGRSRKHAWERYVSAPLSFTTIDRADYSYDHIGNYLKKDIAGGSDLDQVFVYDGLSRLNSVSDGNIVGEAISGTPAREQIWTFDALSNWVNWKKKSLASTVFDQSRLHNIANELDNDDIDSNTPMTEVFDGTDWPNPDYDQAGNMAKFPRPPAFEDAYAAKYDAWNRLITVRHDEDGLLIQVNEYDGLHRRILKEKWVDEALAEIRHYYYNENWQVIEERVEEAGVELSNPVNQYVWHPQYLDSLAMRRYDSNSDGTVEGVYSYLQDAIYNVTAVVSAQGANLGAVVERYTYTPYGEPTVRHGANDADGAVAEWGVDTGGSDIANAYLFTGRERDSETTLQISRYRFYYAPLGRWLNRDFMHYIDGMNLYNYCRSNPTTYIDPFGLYDDPWFNDPTGLPPEDPSGGWGGGTPPSIVPPGWPYGGGTMGPDPGQSINPGGGPSKLPPGYSIPFGSLLTPQPGPISGSITNEPNAKPQMEIDIGGGTKITITPDYGIKDAVGDAIDGTLPGIDEIDDVPFDCTITVPLP